jgi:sensor histidine kinase YesM
MEETNARENLYWKCQIAGWSFQGLLAALIPSLYGGLRWVVVARALLGALLGIVLTDQLRRHMRRNGWLRMPLRMLAPRVGLASLLIATAMVLGVLPFLLVIMRTPSKAGPMAAVLASHVAIVLGWSLVYIGYHYLRGIRAAEAEKWQLKLAVREAELRALRSQLNPHFLFNSLNSLRGLVLEDPARAQEAISGLAGLLRHTLQLSRTGTTTLDKELEATEHYLALEALRFESRLRYAIDVEERAREHPVPPMLIQTLVENAIKHGISRLPEGGAVRIEARKPSDDLHVRVTNTGRLEGGRERGGIGLDNSLVRLRLAFGDRVRLELRESGADEVTCDVLIPPPLLSATIAADPPP